jgi:hypothetical protein
VDTTGKVHFTHRWRAVINESVNAAVPLAVGKEIFLSTSYNTGAILLRGDATGLQKVWSSDDALSNHYNTSVYHQGHLYGLHGRQEYGVELRCVEWKTGKVRWSQPRFGCASMILVDGHLIALTEKGDLVAFVASPHGYQELSRATLLREPCRAQIALAAGRLYARDGKRLICLDLRKVN